MKRPRLFAELFAGTASTTLRLVGGPRMRPPVGYMGSKAGLASSILSTLGLHPGQGADAVLLVDAGPWGWAWSTMLDRDGAAATADVLRGWAGRDPSELWRELADQPPPRGAACADRALPLAPGPRSQLHARLVGRSPRRDADGGRREA